MPENVINVGVDSETKHGVPITFQFHSDELKLSTIVWVKSSKDATRQFLSFLDSFSGVHDRHFVLWGHNLAFDMVSFFHDRHELFREDSVSFNAFGWHIEVIYAHVVFAKFTKGTRHILLIDTAAYFLTKLERLGLMVCPEFPKLEPPRNLGSRNFKPTDKKFCEYAIRDAIIAYRAGLKIWEMHKVLDVPISVSAPHFASRVFRRKFLQEPIPLPPRKIVYSALSSYHGGKNNITQPMGLYKNVYSLDIRSAYPFAMSNFPSFSDQTLFKTMEGNGRFNRKWQFPAFGIYKISGCTENCKWPIIYNHSFKPVIGDFSDLWVTGFELNEALRMQEVKLNSIFGYYYETWKDKKLSPFKAYVDYFFAKKENPEDKIRREFYKLLLNSLYGKFIQSRQASAMIDLVFDLDDNKLIEDVSLIAGGLFNPFIATLITGHTRAYIHQLEHKYQAIHTSTDGIFTQVKPKEKSGLGGVSIEAHGDLLLFRNKLYIFYGSSDKPKSEKLYSTIFKKREIIKYALHGFHGTLETLEKMYQNGIYEYEYIKVNKLRESLRRGLAVNKFESRRATLNLPEK